MSDHGKPLRFKPGFIRGIVQLSNWGERQLEVLEEVKILMERDYIQHQPQFTQQYRSAFKLLYQIYGIDVNTGEKTERPREHKEDSELPEEVLLVYKNEHPIIPCPGVVELIDTEIFSRTAFITAIGRIGEDYGDLPIPETYTTDEAMPITDTIAAVIEEDRYWLIDLCIPLFEKSMYPDHEEGGTLMNLCCTREAWRCALEILKITTDDVNTEVHGLIPLDILLSDILTCSKSPARCFLVYPVIKRKSWEQLTEVLLTFTETKTPQKFKKIIKWAEITMEYMGVTARFWSIFMRKIRETFCPSLSQFKRKKLFSILSLILEVFNLLSVPNADSSFVVRNYLKNYGFYPGEPGREPDQSNYSITKLFNDKVPSPEQILEAHRDMHVSEHQGLIEEMTRLVEECVCPLLHQMITPEEVKRHEEFGDGHSFDDWYKCTICKGLDIFKSLYELAYLLDKNTDQFVIPDDVTDEAISEYCNHGNENRNVDKSDINLSDVRSYYLNIVWANNICFHIDVIRPGFLALASRLCLCLVTSFTSARAPLCEITDATYSVYSCIASKFVNGFDFNPGSLQDCFMAKLFSLTDAKDWKERKVSEFYKDRLNQPHALIDLCRESIIKNLKPGICLFRCSGCLDLPKRLSDVILLKRY